MFSFAIGRKKQAGLNTVHRVPTLATWPKKPCSLDELPAGYVPLLADWLEQGLPLDRILYVPAFQSSGVLREEYVAAWRPDALLLLERQPDRAITRTLIPAARVVLVRYMRMTLDCGGLVTWLDGARVRQARFHYNYSAESEFSPIFNLLLGQAEDYASCILDHDNGACADLREESYVMYNYGRLAYRMDDEMLGHFWDQTTARERWWSRELTRTDYLAAIMRNGVAVVRFCSKNNDRACDYIPAESLTGLEVEQGRQGAALFARTRYGEPVSFPLRPERVEQAKAFCAQWRGALAGI